MRQCQVEGCLNTGQHTGKYRTDGSVIYRNRCRQHHEEFTASKYGLSSIKQVMAKKAGFDTVAAFVNSQHPYRKYRKDYCENVTGFLGWQCTSTIINMVQLDVDHIDGNPENNDPENLQTLCKNCHSVKSLLNKDYLTPGRKRLKQMICETV